MLFLLTGEVQIGKTRWLESLINDLTELGVPCAGVLAPGQWVPSTSSLADGNGFEKLGIDNVLLPGGESIAFARRQDLARAEGSFDEGSQAARAALAWHIDDAAIEQVNAHFDGLAARACAPSIAQVESCSRRDAASLSRHPRRGGISPSCHPCPRVASAPGQPERSVRNEEPKDLALTPGLLVIDELGRLEICCGGGLTSAVDLLCEGPTAAFPHALAVVRDYLLDDAEALLASAWPDRLRIVPNEASRRVVLGAFGFGE